MKKQLLVCGITILLVTGTASNISAQKEKKNDKKEHSAKGNNENEKGNNKNGKGNGSNNANNGNGNNGNGNNGNGNSGYGKVKNNKGNNGNPGISGNKGKMNKGDFAGNGKHLNGANHNIINYYNWTPETFKDRKKLKGQDKVSICHKTSNNNQPAVNIRVSSHAAKAHINHGDVMGECPIVKNSNYSDVFLQKRTVYFNALETSRDELSYSRSIYEYALLRLAYSKSQLATMQANQLSQAEIARKQETVVALEQNVSLLETLIGVAANVLVSKLQ